MKTLSVKDRTSQTLTISCFIVVLSSKSKNRFEGTITPLFLQMHTLEMAIRKCSTLNAAQTVSKHMQTAVTILEALKTASPPS